MFKMWQKKEENEMAYGKSREAAPRMMANFNAALLHVTFNEREGELRGVFQHAENNDIFAFPLLSDTCSLDNAYNDILPKINAFEELKEYVYTFNPDVLEGGDFDYVDATIVAYRKK